MKDMVAFVLRQPLNALLVFVPIALVLRRLGVNDVLVFGTSALAIVPLAGLIGSATEDAAHYVGPGIGGFLSATFGNAAELIIVLFALQAGLTDVVKASLTGSILGNLLLVLGLAMLVGGWGRQKQTFSRTQAGASAGMLVLTVVALLMPDIYAETLADPRPQSAPSLMSISVLVALVMLIVYAASLLFALRTHRQPLSLGSDEDDDAGDAALRLPRSAALTLLAVATVLTAITAELLVGSIENAARTIGLSDLFVGAVVVAIVGNAAEHVSAVIFARGDHMELAVSIAVSSAIQVALLVAPIAVLASTLLGHPMPLLFNHFELGALVFAVLGVSFLTLDGESNWFEGALLLGLYAVIAIIFFFVPSPTPAT
ncbi:MAG: calcium/proton exchanger [Chloroflexota bacterium]